MFVRLKVYRTDLVCVQDGLWVWEFQMEKRRCRWKVILIWYGAAASYTILLPAAVDIPGRQPGFRGRRYYACNMWWFYRRLVGE